MFYILTNGILPIFGIAAIGYFLGKYKIFDVSAAGTINKLVFLVAIPTLCFKLIFNAPFDNFDWLLLIGFFISEIVVYALSFLAARLFLSCTVRESVLLGLAASFGNHLLFVLPIAINLYGDEVAATIAAIVALDSVFIFGSTILIMEILSSDKLSYRTFLKNIFTNPPLLSLLMGISAVVLSIEIPLGLNLFLDFVSGLAAPGALFSLGVILSQTKLFDRIASSLSISAFKLLLHPAIAWLFLCSIFGITFEDARISILVAAAPSGTMALVIASNYNVRTDAIAPTMFFTTLGSLISLTLVAS